MLISLNFPSRGESDICQTWVLPLGYLCEEHTVTTKDGYILSLQSISSKTMSKPSQNPPVLLQHGLAVDAISWLLSPPKRSLPFSLADNGYHVWIVSGRGTKYSRGHKSLNPIGPVYWDWTWQEIFLHDVPATIQYVQHQTGGQRIHYVGHSQGTLVALAALSTNQWTNVLRSAVLLSPIGYMNRITSVASKAAAHIFLAELGKMILLAEFDPKGMEAVGIVMKYMCRATGVDCNHLLSAITGPNCCINSSVIGLFYKHELQPSSTKNYIHLSQMIRTGVVKMYDYLNRVDNMKHYGQSTPPVFNMTGIPVDFPLFISYGDGDCLSDVADVRRLLKDLGHHHKDKIYVRHLQYYAHLDFIMGASAKVDLFDYILDFIKKH